MDFSEKGIFYGETNNTVLLDGLILTDTEYTKPHVDWHYHENMYFTFILEGSVIEGNKKELYNCTPGSLLFHNWEEPHYNIKPEGFTRGFHVEVDPKWLKQADFNTDHLQGSLNVAHPGLKLLMYKIFMETRLNDGLSALSVSSLLMSVFSGLHETQKTEITAKPLWVAKIEEILQDRWSENLSLEYLAAVAGIHPVHLSRDFAKYFHSNLAEYIRKTRIEKALALISQRKMSFTEIAHHCGFFDQSHFLRSFKAVMGTNPSAHKKILFRL